jgi:hypothetical protein
MFDTLEHAAVVQFCQLAKGAIKNRAETVTHTT